MDEVKKYRQKKRLLQVGLMVSFVILMIMMIYYVEYSVRQRMRKNQLITLETVSEKVVSSMNNYFEQQWGHLDYIDETMHFETYDREEEIFEMLQQVRKAHELGNDNTRLLLIDEQGYYYTTEGRRVALWQEMNIGEGKMKEKTELQMANLTELGDHLKQYICFMKRLDTPLTAADGSIFPYMVLAADEQVFEIDLTMGEFGTVSDAFVMTSNGQKVNSQKNKLSLAKTYNLLSALKRAHFVLGDSYQEMLSKIEKEKSGSSLIEYEGREYFLTHHAMCIEDWNAVFIVEREQMVDRITPFIYQLLLVLTAGFFILFLFSMGTLRINWQIEREQERCMNERLQNAARAEAKANKAKSDFLSRMSHDIRTPLNGIIGMTAIAEKTLDDRESVRSCLKKITSSSDHLLELVNEVLDITKIENDKLEVKNAPIDLHELIDRLSDINESRISARSLIYELDKTGLKHPYVVADKTILNQILLNIIGNAVKYTEDNGVIQLKVYDRLLDEERAEYHFIVSDTGIGMTPEFVEHIFDQFAQEEIGARTRYEGTGLGMSITKKMVDLLGGQITVESEKNVGSTFEVTLVIPISKLQKVREDEETQKQIIVNRKYHLLLVEDNELNREIAEFMLEDAGITCRSVENGAEAVEAFEESEPEEYDAILMDVLMPKMDGHEATRRIRGLARPDAKTVPIFAMTASAYEEDREKSLEAGMNTHLTKPIVLDQILEALEIWCGKA